MSALPQITDEQQLHDLIAESNQRPIIIFKHSTRCSISSMALNRMQQASPALDFYLLDVISHRNISNHIADKLAVHHESPQLLLLYRGECVYEASHLEIQPREIHAELSALQ